MSALATLASHASGNEGLELVICIAAFALALYLGLTEPSSGARRRRERQRAARRRAREQKRWIRDGEREEALPRAIVHREVHHP